jgi:hypothetical protein
VILFLKKGKMMSNLKSKEYKIFEEIKHIAPDGYEPLDHFAEVSKMVQTCTAPKKIKARGCWEIEERG